MQVVKHDKVVEVVAVVGKPETFDLIGLSPEQMAVLFLLTGNSSGSGSSMGLYDKIRDALDINWTRALPDFLAPISVADIQEVLTLRFPQP